MQRYGKRNATRLQKRFFGKDIDFCLSNKDYWQTKDQYNKFRCFFLPVLHKPSIFTP